MARAAYNAFPEARIMDHVVGRVGGERRRWPEKTVNAILNRRQVVTGQDIGNCPSPRVGHREHQRALMCRLHVDSRRPFSRLPLERGKVDAFAIDPQGN